MDVNFLLDLVEHQEGLSSGLALLRSPNDYLTDTQFRHKDSERPPAHEPGDGWIVVGMLVGAFVGAATGVAVAISTGVINVFFGLAGGAVLGGIAGTFVGDAIKKAKRRRR